MAARKLHKIEAQTAIGSLTYYPLDELSELGLTEARRLIVETVVSAVKGYRLATSELLTTTYHELRDSLPDYLRRLRVGTRYVQRRRDHHSLRQTIGD